MIRPRLGLTVAAVTLGLAAPAASAHVQPRSYQTTYPVASALCSRVAAGQAPRHLRADTTQINAACGALGASYQQAVNTFDAAVAPIPAQVSSTLAAVRAARQTAQQTHHRSAYRAAVQQARATLKGLRAQERADRQAYVTAIRAARQTFWTTIHALRGAGALPADSGTPTAPAAPGVPSAA